VNVIFRRIKGRIIPIMQDPVKRRVVQGSAAAAVPALGLASVLRSQGKSEKPSRAWLAAGYGLQVASGLVAGIPSRGAKGVAAAIAGSVALDLASTAAFTKSVSDIKGTKGQKIKEYAKHQTYGTALGYGVFGGTLVLNKQGRARFMKATQSAWRRVTNGK
jgi:hypothetical protein